MDAYLDNSATTPVCPEAIAAVQNALENTWGNPSSMHQKGVEADMLLERSRASVAQALGCAPQEVYFTSGGTEGNNIALRGAAYAMRRYGRRIVSSNVEHPSIDETLSQLEQEGFEIVRLPVDQTGKIAAEDIARAVTPYTILVSIMSVNNETGTMQPIDQVQHILRRNRSPALFHCDAVQSFGKMDLRPGAIGADLMTISAHKIHGPKGVGALYIKKGTRILPRTTGGAQEDKVRPGTQPMPAIAGFGAAVEALPNLHTAQEQMQALRERMLAGLREIGGVVVNSPADALPYVTNISVLGKNGNNMLNYLSERGVYVSTGSACSKGKPSAVLRAMHLDKPRLDGALRISFSRDTTVEDVDKLVWAIAEGKNALRSTLT